MNTFTTPSPQVAVIVPTVRYTREKQLETFLAGWSNQFALYNVKLYIVTDSDEPVVNGRTTREVMGEMYADLIYPKNDGVRNLGFAQAYLDGADMFISLDDDVLPCEDTIGDHLRALESRVPITYMNSVDDVYMRGFPYHIRNEAEVVFSHGLWHGVYDFDASTQLVLGTPQPRHRKMPVPYRIKMPVCVMNVAFKRKVLSHYYQAPMFGTINRFADIWSGWEVKEFIDDHHWAMVNGYATVHHRRASDPFVNLMKEAHGLQMNEHYGTGTYFDEYRRLRERWQEFLTSYPTPYDRRYKFV